MVYAPIWKDTFYTITASSLSYTVSLDDSVIYSGNAVRMPGNTTISININQIARDYLRQDIFALVDTTSTATTNTEAYRVFTLKNGNGTTLETYGFLFNYDKGNSWNGGATTLSLPINGEYVSGGWRPKTTVTSSRVVTTYKSNNTDYNKVVCADYGLIYLNARGGWDVFYYTGKCNKTTDTKYYTINHPFNNNTAEYETDRYASDITDKYELNTGLLTEEQSKVYARQLATSNRCYLHIVDENKVIPVIITDTTTPVKTEDSEDGGLISYKTTVKASQVEYRQ